MSIFRFLFVSRYLWHSAWMSALNPGMYNHNWLSHLHCTNVVAWPVIQSVNNKSTLPMENSICSLTLCILQGASEDITPKKEKPEKGNENYQKVKEVSTKNAEQQFLFNTAFAVWICTSEKSLVNQSMWAGMWCLCQLKSCVWCFCPRLFTSGGFQCSE